MCRPLPNQGVLRPSWKLRPNSSRDKVMCMYIVNIYSNYRLGRVGPVILFHHRQSTQKLPKIVQWNEPLSDLRVTKKSYWLRRPRFNVATEWLRVPSVYMRQYNRFRCYGLITYEIRPEVMICPPRATSKVSSPIGGRMSKTESIEATMINAPFVARWRPGQMLYTTVSANSAYWNESTNRLPNPNDTIGSGTFGLILPSSFKNLSGRKVLGFGYVFSLCKMALM